MSVSLIENAINHKLAVMRRITAIRLPASACRPSWMITGRIGITRISSASDKFLRAQMLDIRNLELWRWRARDEITLPLSRRANVSLITLQNSTELQVRKLRELYQE